MAERRALLIGVSGFAEAAEARLADFDFAASAIEDLSAVLRDGFGYSVTALTEPGLTSIRLGQAVREAIVSANRDDVLLLHVLTHGIARGSLLYALGCDGAIDETVEVGGWLGGVQNAPGRPLVLFSLDMCHSGTVTLLPGLAGDESGERRGWVLAACEADRSAFDGRFTRSLTTVLAELARGDIEVGSDAGFVPLQTVARAVRSAVVTTARSADGYQQFVVSSKLDMADSSVVPFFPAPSVSAAGAAAPAGEHRQPPETAPRPYPVPADLSSFVFSAAGSAVISDLTSETTGCFSGREHELRILSRWFDRAADGPLAVVTGSPGAGKSALVGLLACAAHPLLREPMRPIWSVAAASPGVAGRLCAVDAGEHSLQAVAEALGRQLEVSGDVSPDSLVSVLAELSGPVPVFVVDSLDEADDAAEVASWLVRLASLRRADGAAGVRLLVGTRPYEDSAELRRLAGETYGQLHDLDAVSLRVLEDDLQRYVTSLLRAIPGYRQAHQVTGTFSGKLAETLTAGDRVGRGWGEFLVAGLFTRYFAGTFRLTDGAGAAERVAGTVPRNLPGVLDLDFDRHRDNPWLRPVLGAVAHARGTGMPVSVIRRVAAALASREQEPGTNDARAPVDSPEPSLAEVTTALRLTRSYVRRSVDSEKLVVYRLFHESIGDRLRRPEDAPRVHQALLSVTGPPGRRVWSAAEPYVIAHALDYAADSAEFLDDPGFLVYARNDRYLGRFSEGLGQLLQDVDPTDPILARRMLMARAAVESGQPAVARYLADLPGEQPLPWMPLWVVGVPDRLRPPAAVVPATLDVLGELRVWPHGPASVRPERHQDISAFALTRQDGQLILLAADALRRSVMVIRPGGKVAAVAAHGARVTAVVMARYDQDAIVVSGGEDGQVQMHSLATGERLHEPVNVHSSVSALAVGGNPQDPVVACITSPGILWTWRIGPGQNPLLYRWRLPSRARSVAVTALSGQPVVLIGDEDGNVRSLDCNAHIQLKVLSGHGGPVLAVAVEVVAGRAVAVTGSPSGHVHQWDLLSGREKGEPVKVCNGPVVALALRATPGQLLCLVGGPRVGGTALWDLSDGRKQDDFGRSGATSVALSVDHPVVSSGQDRRQPSTVEILAGADGAALAVIGDYGGGLTGLDFDSGRILAAIGADGGDPVTSIDVTDLAGIPTAVIGSGHVTRLWQPSSNALIDVSGELPSTGYSPGRGTAVVEGKLVAVEHTQAGALTVDGERIHGADDVTALVVTHLDGRPVAVTGDQGGRVRIWDLATRRKSDELDIGKPVFSLAATVNGRLAVGAGGRVYGFRRHGSGSTGLSDHPPVA